MGGQNVNQTPQKIKKLTKMTSNIHHCLGISVKLWKSLELPENFSWSLLEHCGQEIQSSSVWHPQNNCVNLIFSCIYEE